VLSQEMTADLIVGVKKDILNSFFHSPLMGNIPHDQSSFAHILVLVLDLFFFSNYISLHRSSSLYHHSHDAFL
jgi:hypothetical protein